MAATTTKRKPPMRKTAGKTAGKRGTARRAGTSSTARRTPPAR